MNINLKRIERLLPVFLYMIICIMPVVARNIGKGVLFVTVFLLFLSCLNNTKINMNYVLWFIVFALYMILEYFRVSYISSIGNLYETILFFFPILYYLLSHNNTTEKDVKTVVLLFILIQTYVSAENIVLLAKQPNLSKYYTGGVEYVVTGYRYTNLGGVSNVFVAVCVSLVLVVLIKRCNKLNKILYVIFLILNIAFVFMARSTICLLFLLIGVFVIIFKWSKKNSVILVCFLIFIFAILFLLSGQLRVFVEQLSIPSEYKNRFLNFSDWISGAYSMESLGFINGRYKDYLTSIISFIKNPIIGVGMIYSQDVSIIGMHSEFWDYLARYGIIGLLLIATMLRGCFKNAFFNNPLQVKIYLLVLLYSFFNPMVSRAVGFTVFYILLLFVNQSFEVKAENEIKICEDNRNDIICVK